MWAEEDGGGSSGWRGGGRHLSAEQRAEVCEPSMWLWEGRGDQEGLKCFVSGLRAGSLFPDGLLGIWGKIEWELVIMIAEYTQITFKSKWSVLNQLAHFLWVLCFILVDFHQKAGARAGAQTW